MLTFALEYNGWNYCRHRKDMMNAMKGFINFLLGFLFIISCVIGYHYVWPEKQTTESILIESDNIVHSDSQKNNRFNVTLIWPERIRARERGEIQLELCLEDDYRIKTQNTNNQSQKERQNIIETRIDLPGVMIDPGKEYLQVYNQDCNRFQWILTTNEPDLYKGKLWMYSVSKKEGDSDFQKTPIFVKDMEIESYIPMNIPRQYAYIICSLGIVAFVFLLSKFLKCTH